MTVLRFVSVDLSSPKPEPTRKRTSNYYGVDPIEPDDPLGIRMEKAERQTLLNLLDTVVLPFSLSPPLLALLHTPATDHRAMKRPLPKLRKPSEKKKNW